MNRFTKRFDFDYDTGCLKELTDCLDVFGGGGKGGSTQPTYTPPPAAPSVQEAATMKTAEDLAAQDVMKKKQQTQGAKSLQIPLGTDTTGTTTATPIGTV